MGCTGCGNHARGAVAIIAQGGSLRAQFALSTIGGTGNEAVEVTAAARVGQSNAVSATVTVIALTSGAKINVTIYGSNDLSIWTDLGEVTEWGSVGSTLGEVVSVTTCYVRAAVTLQHLEAAQGIVALRLHTASL